MSLIKNKIYLYNFLNHYLKNCTENEYDIYFETDKCTTYSIEYKKINNSNMFTLYQCEVDYETEDFILNKLINTETLTEIVSYIYDNICDANSIITISD